MVSLKNVSPPSEGIRYDQGEITAVWNGEGLGPGTLYIAETCVSWFDGSGMGFSLEYPSISLHAISRDFTAYPREHLYVMVNTKLNHNCEKGVEEEDNESTDDDCNADSISPVTEICFVPSDKAALEPMFSAISECQALHPDPEDSDSDFEGDEYDVEEAEQGQIDLPTFYNFEEGLSQLTLEGQDTLERLEGMLTDSASQKHHCMAGVRPEDTPTGCFNESGAVGVSGQFEDADIDHWTASLPDGLVPTLPSHSTHPPLLKERGSFVWWGSVWLYCHAEKEWIQRERIYAEIQ